MNEKELIIKAKNGDNDALTELIIRYGSLLKAVVAPFYIVGTDHDDLMQEATLGLIKAVKDYGFDKKQSFSTFVYLVARQRIIDTMRKANTLKHYALNKGTPIDSAKEDEGGEYTVDLAVNENSPLDNYLLAESDALLASVIKEVLTDRETQILRLYLNGKSYLEIGEELRISTKTVDNTLSNIKKKIRAKKDLFD